MDIVTYALLNGKIKDYASNVDEWLEENVDPAAGYVLDRSLQMENAAAPADMVGDLKNTLNSEIATRQTYVRPNLLDNWYFVGGGSQQGGGQFPINQRGQTSYSNDGYTIDRWKNETGGTVEITASGVNFAKTISVYTYNQNVQYVPIDDSWVGKTFTLSALSSKGLVEGSGVLSTSSTVDTDGLSSGRFRFKYDNTNKCVVVDSITTATDIIWYAVKLELGSGQTLAHQENGVWVLNEIPDYGEQLLKCQRYYVYYPNYYRQRAVMVQRDTIFFNFIFPVDLSRNPTIDTITLLNVTGGSVQGFTYSRSLIGNCLSITATKESHGLTDAMLAIRYGVSAEL